MGRSLAVALATLVVLASCGGKLDLDDSTDGASPLVARAPVQPGDAAPGAPSFVLGEPSAPHAPPTCIPCKADADCGKGDGCVASLSETPFCSPGCSKEGFCSPDRLCRYVGSPTGLSWRACVPRDRCEVPARAVSIHAGTW